MENNMKRGPEESSGSARKSTMEKLQLLVKEMQVANKLQTLHKFINMISYKVEEREFAQGMEGRSRRAEELKKMVAEKEERLRKAKDEVVLIYPLQQSSYSFTFELNSWRKWTHYCGIRKKQSRYSGRCIGTRNP